MSFEPVTEIISIAAPLMRDNVDTDQIIPSREMKTVSREGLAEGLFAGWRYTQPETREPDPDFLLNQGIYRDARILLAGSNFGCGSSREHAVWALREFGIRAIIAESFGEIFYNNCIRNGVLPIALSGAQVRAFASVMPRAMRIELAPQRVLVEPVSQARFEIEPFNKRMLLDGSDPIDLTLQAADDIDAWLDKDRARQPWLYESPSS